MPWGDGVVCPRCGGSMTQTAGPLCCPRCGYPNPPARRWSCEDCAFDGDRAQAEQHREDYPRHTVVDPPDA